MCIRDRQYASASGVVATYLHATQQQLSAMEIAQLDVYKRQLLGQPVPQALHVKISAGGGNADNAGTMRRGQE